MRRLVSYVAGDKAEEDEALSHVLSDILDTPVSPELLPAIEGQIAQKTEDLVGPYELHDFFLYYVPSTAASSPSSSSAPACLTDPRWARSASLPGATGACPPTPWRPCGWRSWRGWSDVNIYADLFLTFAKIGVCTFGGGYAMLPILQRELVEKRGWATEEELSDYFAIGQCTPGIIAVNTATFVGHSRKGAAGGVVATLGLVFPCLVIIMLIAAFLQNFAEQPVVVHAFNGVRACVCALILSSVLKLRKSTVVDGPTAGVFAVVLVLAVLGSFVSFPAGWAGSVLSFLCSPVVLVVAAGVAGLCIRAARGGLRP